jgi:hypothetical protein
MNTNRILLNENTAASNEIIANEMAAANNGKTLLSMLDKLGLTVESVNDWAAIEQEFKKDYPKAPLTFNLQANGIENEYREAEAFYTKHRHALRFEPFTDEQIEAIKENQRVYADQPNQIEAFELFNTVKDSLLRLQEIGVKIDLNKTYLVNRVLIGDERQKPALKIDPKAMYHTLVNLK